MKTGIHSGIKVLIVDDENAVADSLALVFSVAGYDTRVANSAEEAAEIIRQWEPRLVILDVVLPGMNGIEFTIQLKNSHPGCRVVLFSGQEITSSLVQNAQERGHEFAILAKPVHPTLLLEEASRLSATGTAPGN